jgi:hypothetical protein
MLKPTTIGLFTIILLLSTSNCATDNEKLNEVFYGIFAQNRLPRPEYFLKCFDEVIATRIIKLIQVLLPQLIKPIPPVRKIKDEITYFSNNMDKNIIWCLGYNY